MLRRVVTRGRRRRVRRSGRRPESRSTWTTRSPARPASRASSPTGCSPWATWPRASVAWAGDPAAVVARSPPSSARPCSMGDEIVAGGRDQGDRLRHGHRGARDVGHGGAGRPDRVARQERRGARPARLSAQAMSRRFTVDIARIASDILSTTIWMSLPTPSSTRSDKPVDLLAEHLGDLEHRLGLQLRLPVELIRHGLEPFSTVPVTSVAIPAWSSLIVRRSCRASSASIAGSSSPSPLGRRPRGRWHQDLVVGADEPRDRGHRARRRGACMPILERLLGLRDELVEPVDGAGGGRHPLEVAVDRCARRGRQREDLLADRCAPTRPSAPRRPARGRSCDRRRSGPTRSRRRRRDGVAVGGDDSRRRRSVPRSAGAGRANPSGPARRAPARATPPAPRCASRSCSCSRPCIPTFSRTSSSWPGQVRGLLVDDVAHGLVDVVVLRPRTASRAPRCAGRAARSPRRRSARRPASPRPRGWSRPRSARRGRGPGCRTVSVEVPVALVDVRERLGDVELDLLELRAHGLDAVEGG